MNPTSKERSPGVDLSALREALAKATPGPWTREKPGADENGWPSGVAVAGTPGRQTIYASPPGGCFPSADCDLIVLLRNTAPALIAELEAARAERDARARSELEDLRDWCEEQRDDWKREADRAPAKIVAASCAMAAGSFGTAMEEIGKRLASLTPQPTPGAEAPKQPSARDGAKEG